MDTFVDLPTLAAPIYASETKQKIAMTTACHQSLSSRTALMAIMEFISVRSETQSFVLKAYFCSLFARGDYGLAALQKCTNYIKLE